MPECYGFNWTTLTCTPYKVQTEDSIEEERIMQFQQQCLGGQCLGGRKKGNKSSAPPAPESCNPDVCRMKSGICVDCTKCMQHCTCQFQLASNSIGEKSSRGGGSFDNDSNCSNTTAATYIRSFSSTSSNESNHNRVVPVVSPVKRGRSRTVRPASASRSNSSRRSYAN